MPGLKLINDKKCNFIARDYIHATSKARRKVMRVAEQEQVYER